MNSNQVQNKKLRIKQFSNQLKYRILKSIVKKKRIFKQSQSQSHQQTLLDIICGEMLFNFRKSIENVKVSENDLKSQIDGIIGEKSKYQITIQNISSLAQNQIFCEKFGLFVELNSFIFDNEQKNEDCKHDIINLMKEAQEYIQLILQQQQQSPQQKQENQENIQVGEEQPNFQEKKYIQNLERFIQENRQFQSLILDILFKCSHQVKESIQKYQNI